MSELIIDRIKQIKKDEDDFKTEWWKNNYVSYDKFHRENNRDIWKHVSKHVSEIKIEEIDKDDDLIRIFEYFILCRNDIVYNRVKEKYR